MRTVSLVATGWTSGPLVVADGFWARWRGLRFHPAGTGLLLGGFSVHGVGLSSDLWAVGIDRNRRVVGVKRLRRGGLVGFLRARWIAELPLDRDPPPVGAVLAFGDS